MSDATPSPAMAPDPTRRDDGPAERLQRLWDEGRPPDVDAFLAPEGPLSPGQVARVLRVDQRGRWRGGAAVPAEAYLARHPAVAADADAAVDLIFNEFLLREGLDDRPGPDEYPGRFPGYADLLRAQIELHLAVAAGTGVSRATVRSSPSGAVTRVTTPGGEAAWPAVPGYEFLGELGRGGMGVVYKARQISLKRVVALKMLLAGPYAGPEHLDRFRAEAEAVARLRHPNVVQIFEIGEHGGRPYLVLEYFEGGSLDCRLGGTPQNPRAAAALAETLARAVQAAHEQGVVHRDLKPANILLSFSRDPEGSASVALPSGSRLNECVPKVADFGLAKQTGADAGRTPSEAILGTPSYMAPEQASGRTRDVGPLADVYALGAILYQMLTGRPPFRGETPLDTLQQVVADDPVPLRQLQPKVPLDLATICLKCLEKDPRRRYGSAADLAEDLRRFLAGEPIRARPIGPAARLSRWCRRKPAVAGLLALVLALAVGAFAAVTALWLRAERLRLQAENDRADAVADYRLARDSVEEYAVRVSDDLRLREEDLHPLRKKLLETVVPFYEQLVERHADDATVRAERGKAYKRLASLTEEIDDKAKAIPLYQKALPLLEEQLRAHPGDRDRIRDVTECRVNLAGLYHLTGQVGEAEAEYQRLLVWQGQLARDNPDEVKYQEDLAHNHNNLAVVYADTGRPSEAVAEQEKALKVLTALADAHPGADHRRRLAVCRGTLAQMCLAAGDAKRAEAEYNTAAAALEDLVAKEPDNAGHQQELGVVLFQLGGLYLNTDRTTQAIPTCERALGLLEAVVRKTPSLTEAHKDLSQCLTALAGIYQRVGREDDAERLYGRAIALYEGLRAQNPRVHFYLHHLAGARKAKGYMHFGAGNLAKAEEEFQKVAAIYEKLAGENPFQSEYAAELAIGQANLAAVYQQSGRVALAEPEYEKAIARLTALAAGDKAGHNYDGLLLKCRMNLATLSYKTGRLVRAKELYEEALPTAEELARANSDPREYVLVVAGIQSSLGAVANMRGDATAAVPWFDKSIEVLLRRLHKEPEDVAMLRLLRDSRAGRARALSRRGSHADAVKECEEALTIDTRLPRDATRALRALTLGRQGQWVKALAEADEISYCEIKLSAAGLYDLGCTYALKAAAAEREPTAEKHAARAVELLVRARAAGYFKGATFVEQLRKDADLEVLRKRGDFQKLLAEVEKPAEAK